MTFHTITGFESFCRELRKAGFALGGSNSEGIFSLCQYFGDKIIAHTGDMDTDPWEWRIRAVKECRDIAYSKLFFNKGGWITRPWYPYFLAVRREHMNFNELYCNGKISREGKLIYELISEKGVISLHDIKLSLDIRDSKIESELTRLQMKMLITICGETYKLSKMGEPYGWPVTTFCTAEKFFGEDIFDESCEIDIIDAENAIASRIYQLNPDADRKNINKFIAIG